MKLIKKLSAKDILGPVVKLVKEQFKVNDQKMAYSVAGIATGYETGISTYGTWVRFIGDFQATNYLTNDVIRAGKAHIPDVLESALLASIAELNLEGVKKSAKGGDITSYTLPSPIEFAYKVEIIRKEDNEDGSVSYEYITTPVTKVAENDRLGHLTALLEDWSETATTGDIEKEVATPAKKAASGRGKK